MAHHLLSGKPGEKHLLLGNEAIVRGSLEAGVGFVSCYPGTPSSEVPDTFFRLSPDGDYYFEYSTNEKVALEVGGGAALAGVPTLVTMKHVGVNVAADPLMTLAYVGTPGGLVLLSADDPGCHSSQNEQDNRYYARLAGMPCLEPCSPQETKDMTRFAFDLSMRHAQPVLLRTTTRVNHARGPVEYGPLPESKPGAEMEINPRRFVPIPAVARVRHLALLEALDKLRAEAETSPWNKTSGRGKLGFIASGIARAYLKDALADLNLTNKVRVLELGFTYPMPDKLIAKFVKPLDHVVIVEELEPLIENAVRTICQKKGIKADIIGKGDLLPRYGEYSTEIVRNAVAKVAGLKIKPAAVCPADNSLSQRPPNLCAGCPHRAAYLAVRQIYGDDMVCSSDIGCYTLGILPPLKAADFLLCMGSSISTGSGLAKASGRNVVAFIGDSTFFHSGMTGLVNAVFNKHDILLVILDNKTTAMTGHQPHPGVEKSSLGDNEARIDIEAVVKACGVEHFRKVNPLNLKTTKAAIEELKALSGVRVLLAEEPCPLFNRKIGVKGRPMIVQVPEGCDGCKTCIEQMACPAFYVDNGQVRIDPTLCSGCMLCLQICPSLKTVKRS